MASFIGWPCQRPLSFELSFHISLIILMYWQTSLIECTFLFTFKLLGDFTFPQLNRVIHTYKFHTITKVCTTIIDNYTTNSKGMIWDNKPSKRKSISQSISDIVIISLSFIYIVKSISKVTLSSLGHIAPPRRLTIPHFHNYPSISRWQGNLPHIS